MTESGAGLPPVTGAWRAGDPPGARQWFTGPGALALEAGGALPEYTLAYETWGRLNADRSNAVLVEHALTGDSHAAGPAGPGQVSAGWWDELIGPGKAFDTDSLFVVAPNVLGGCQGSTGPSSPDPDGKPWGSRFPALTVRDQVAAEAALADALGIDRWAAVAGGSMGGMRALEWAVTLPGRVESVLVLASTARASAEQIAWAAPQLHAIRSDVAWHGGDYYTAAEGPHRGLGVARRIAHVTYRCEPELRTRFGNRAQEREDPLRGGRFAVESYLDHHADKLVRRFDAGSYAVLTESMNTHDVGRGRGGVAAALGRVTARTVVASVDSDRLYPPYQSDEIAAGTGGTAAVLNSPYGHDSFLIETEQIAGLVKTLLG
ncbi:homoserine O-acetyltransferase MetX [Amycolatopsis benzoatilytica]|uniref:homoserine O-acetyltransferase MetX n=1 Tax=Amycolatopsis benzoatilytica TaxID=346045 RepID=UPI00037C8B55|nr:homoserine O-acetyltransferase [Amycolatopsis benzoatilytica]